MRALCGETLRVATVPATPPIKPAMTETRTMLIFICSSLGCKTYPVNRTPSVVCDVKVPFQADGYAGRPAVSATITALKTADELLPLFVGIAPVDGNCRLIAVQWNEEDARGAQRLMP